MTRVITVGAAQSGPIHRTESRPDAVERLLVMMRAAHSKGCDIVVFTECALTAFFPHWFIEDQDELNAWFEREMPNAATQPLFDEAARLGIGFHLGFAEIADEEGETRHFNASVLVDKGGLIIGKFRKIHLPGVSENIPEHPFQNLEKLYFDVGNLGFNTWNAFGGIIGTCICNDRRWPETYRVLTLKGAEMILLGYNTPSHNPANPASDHLACFHNHLCMQAGAYQNACWVVGVAKAGVEEGVAQIGQSCIISPTGEIVAMASSLEDELIVAECDLNLAKRARGTSFNFEANRRIENYGLIAEQKGIDASHASGSE
jgi:predicted amidohydrolase